MQVVQGVLDLGQAPFSIIQAWNGGKEAQARRIVLASQGSPLIELFS